MKEVIVLAALFAFFGVFLIIYGLYGVIAEQVSGAIGLVVLGFPTVYGGLGIIVLSAGTGKRA